MAGNGKLDGSRAVKDTNNLIDDEKASRVVAEVIHEYDVIESDPSKDVQMMETNIKSNETAPGAKGNNSCHKDQEKQNIMDIEENLIYKDSDSSLEDQIDFMCPRVNCPEKIIICFDLSSEMDKVTFRSRAGDKWTPLQLIKRALRLFLCSKSRICRQHEFALVILHEKSTWVHDFTNNPKDIINLLEDLEETSQCEAFNMSSLFDVIKSNIDVPMVEGDQTVLPPPYIVRAILFLARSYTPVEFLDKETFRLLDSSPYFFVDALYVHEPPSEENKCEAIFDCICDLDQKGQSYIFEAARNPTKLYDQMAQLLAHPLQRPLQRNISYRLHNVADIDTLHNQPVQSQEKVSS